MKQFITLLISSCQKANSIAVACRQEPELFSLLTQKGDEKNAKFEHDFKTLADVLIQETVRHELSRHPAIKRDQVQGEESNTFTGPNGQPVIININDDAENTREILDRILDVNENVSSLLAAEVHKEVELSNQMKEYIEALEDKDLDLSKVGVWIDPIDGTSQYIQGVEELNDGYPVKGLQVAKVLIGVYDIDTGKPVLGVVGTPFSPDFNIVFGSTLAPVVFPRREQNAERKSSGEEECILVIGSSEEKEILDKLGKKFKILKAGGAGHKMMMVLEGVADVYINSTGTVYVWDTCGPHALLEATGGGVVTFQDLQDVVYNRVDDVGPALANGIIVYRDTKYLDLVKQCLAK